MHEPTVPAGGEGALEDVDGSLSCRYFLVVGFWKSGGHTPTLYAMTW